MSAVHLKHIKGNTDSWYTLNSEGEVRLFCNVTVSFNTDNDNVTQVTNWTNNCHDKRKYQNT